MPADGAKRLPASGWKAGESHQEHRLIYAKNGLVSRFKIANLPSFFAINRSSDVIGMFVHLIVYLVAS